jgi:hypothetical protein
MIHILVIMVENVYVEDIPNIYVIIYVIKLMFVYDLHIKSIVLFIYIIINYKY